MARGPKTAAVVLTGDERSALQRLVRRCGAGQAAVMRARIVLAADAEPETTNRAIAVRLGISRQSVITWRQRFLAHRLEGLVDAPRSGAPRQVGDEAVEALLLLGAGLQAAQEAQALAQGARLVPHALAVPPAVPARRPLRPEDFGGLPTGW